MLTGTCRNTCTVLTSVACVVTAISIITYLLFIASAAFSAWISLLRSPYVRKYVRTRMTTAICATNVSNDA